MRSQYCRLREQETSFRYAEFEVMMVQMYKDGHRKGGYLILEETTGSEVKTWVAFNYRSHLITMDEDSKIKE